MKDFHGLRIYRITTEEDESLLKQPYEDHDYHLVTEDQMIRDIKKGIVRKVEFIGVLRPGK